MLKTKLCLVEVFFSLFCFQFSNSYVSHWWKKTWDFPGGAVVKNLPATAGYTGLIPSHGRLHIPHAWGKAYVPQLLSQRSVIREASAVEPVHLSEEQLHLLQQQRPRTTKNKWLKFFKTKRKVGPLLILPLVSSTGSSTYISFGQRPLSHSD